VSSRISTARHHPHEQPNIPRCFAWFGRLGLQPANHIFAIRHYAIVVVGIKEENITLRHKTGDPNRILVAGGRGKANTS
jgi:hypothetical protein